MRKKLIIFEFADEVEVFISQKSVDTLKDENSIVLAIQPCAQAFLRRLNIAYVNTIGFIDKESHQNILYRCVEIIEPLRSAIDLKDEIGVKAGYSDAFIFYLRHYSLLYILWLIEIIENAIKKIQPETVIAVISKYIPDDMNQIPRSERFVGLLVSKITEKNGIRCDFCRGHGKGNYRPKQNIAFFTEIAKFFVFYLNLLILMYKTKGNKPILYSSNSYNLKNVIKPFVHVFNNSISIVLFGKPTAAGIKRMFTDSSYWNMLLSLPSIGVKGGINFSASLSRMMKTVKNILSSKSLLNYREIDFSEIVLLKLEKKMPPFLSKLHGQTYHLNNLIKKVRPSLIFSQAARGIFYNLGEIASHRNVPSIMISHGSHVPPSNRFEDIEWGEHGLGLMDTPYTYLAIQSPWALRYLKEKPSHSIPIITGPLLFTKIADRNQKEHIKKRIVPEHCNKTIIVHAGTPKPFQSSRPYVYETIDEYINNINSLINAVETIDNIHLIIRFRSSNYLKLDDFLELLYKSDCYSVHWEGSFTDYLTISDVLISYSSTTIEEALQNRVPVLIYDPHNRYCHIKSAQIFEGENKMVIDSCYYINSKEKLTSAIRWIIANHLVKKVPESMWNRHVFSRNEIVDLTVYFRELFNK